MTALNEVMNKSRRHLWMLLLILAVAGAAYGTLLPAPYLSWDDDSNIFKNPYYQAGWWAIFWQSPYFGLYVPLTSTIWQLLYVAGEGAAWPFRLLNVSLHLANILLVYILLGALARRWSLAGWTVLVGTAVFALHPVQVEAVAWISGGRDLLSAFFSLAAVALYFRQGRLARAGSTLMFAAALLSKPGAAVLPVVIAGLDLLLNAPSKAAALNRLKERGAQWIAWLLGSMWAVWKTMGAQEGHVDHYALWLRPWLMGDTYAFYVRKLLWPWPLTGNYARTPVAVLSDYSTLPAAIVFALALAGFTWWAWRKDRRGLMVWVWMALILPVSGLTGFAFQRISGTADHYLYLPMAAASAVCMWLAARLAAGERAARLKIPLTMALAGVMAVFTLTTFLRVQVWRGNETFFRDMAEHSPDSYSAGIGMSVVNCQDKQDYDEGVRWTEVALKARPNDIMALANQGFCLIRAGNYLRVTDLAFYLDKLDLKTLEETQPTAYSSLLASIGTAEIELKQYEDGYQYLCEAYRVKPGEPSHLRNLQVAGNILKSQGLEPQCEEPPPADDPGALEDLINPED